MRVAYWTLLYLQKHTRTNFILLWSLDVLVKHWEEVGEENEAQAKNMWAIERKRDCVQFFLYMSVCVSGLFGYS